MSLNSAYICQLIKPTFITAYSARKMEVCTEIPSFNLCVIQLYVKSSFTRRAGNTKVVSDGSRKGQGKLPLSGLLSFSVNIPLHYNILRPYFPVSVFVSECAVLNKIFLFIDSIVKKETWLNLPELGNLFQETILKRFWI